MVAARQQKREKFCISLKFTHKYFCFPNYHNCSKMSRNDHPSGSTSSSSSSSSGTSGKHGKTSLAPSPASASKKTKIDDMSKVEFIEESLQCSVCLTFPASPIHACDNAHIVCGRCAPTLRACPICPAQLPRIPLKLSPDSDKLAKKANKTIRCENFEAGCVEGVLSTKFPDHLSSCYYREITCDFCGLCTLDVKFRQYIKHLEEEHDVEIAPGPKLTRTYCDLKKLPGKTWTFWGHSVINFDGQQFIVHAQHLKKSGLFYTWAAVLGDPDLAKKYRCELKFKIPNKRGRILPLSVSAFHELHYNDSEAKFFEYWGDSAVAVVPMAMIRKLGELNGGKIEVSYEIKEA